MTERLFLRLADDAVCGPEANVPPGTLRAFPVGHALQQYVSHILSYRETVPAGHEVVERVLPDGAVRLIVNLGEPPTVAESTGLAMEAVGASAKPVLVRLRRRVEGLSITLRPGAAVAVLGVPAGVIAAQAVPLEELWRSEATELLERLAEHSEDAARARVLREVLQRRILRSGAAAHDAAQHAARLISSAGGQRPLRDVADELGIGERRLQQLFHTHVGLSPRVWSRLARFHALLRVLRGQHEPRWAQLAVDSGFYDQSHLVKEFRALGGLTPTQFLAEPSLREARSGSSKTPP